MKVAILYSGQPRHVKECYQNHHDTFIAPNPEHQFDIFCHLWRSEKKENFWSQYPDRGTWDLQDEKFVLEKWRPRKYEFENQKIFSSDDCFPDPRFPHPINNTLSMFYSLEKCNDLKNVYEQSNNFVYDCVIRLRTDEMFIAGIGKLEDYDMNCLNVLDEFAHLDYGLNDHFAFGSSSIVNNYCDVFSNFEKICSLGAAVNPECLLGFNFQKYHQLPVKKHKWNYRLRRDL